MRIKTNYCESKRICQLLPSAVSGFGFVGDTDGFVDGTVDSVVVVSKKLF